MCSSFVSPHSGCKHFCCESDGTETEFLHAVRRFLDTNDRRRAGRPRSDTRRSGQAGTLSQLVHSGRSAPNIIGFNGLCCVSSTIVCVRRRHAMRVRGHLILPTLSEDCDDVGQSLATLMWRRAELRLEPDPTAICLAHAPPRSRGAAGMSAIEFDTRHEDLLHTLHMRRALGDRLAGATQFRSELLGDVMGVGSIADDLGANEDDQFGPRG